MSAGDGGEGGRLAAGRSFDCVVLDWMLPGHDGLDILAAMRRSGDGARPPERSAHVQVVPDRMAGATREVRREAAELRDDLARPSHEEEPPPG